MAYTKKWYKERKENLMVKRKSRYNSDPEYRQKVLERAREVRRKQREERAKKPKLVKVSTGKNVKVTGIDHVCESIGITPDRIAYFQKQGYVPPALVSRPARAYTDHQITLIKGLENFLKEHSINLRRPAAPEGKVAQRLLKAYVQTIHETWEN